MNILRAILFPFSLAYHLITAARNRLYDAGLKPSAGFDVPLVSVGNLTVGGTGKTPMIEYLIRTLGGRFSLATVSRGYGRAGTGIRLATEDDSALTIGDEPFQFYKKFGDGVAVAVGADRVLTIATLLQERPGVDVVLLDDAFQHRRVKPGFQILLTDYHRPFYKDFLLPTGNLRESKTGASRADVVVVTKCPANLSGDEMMAISSGIGRYTPKPVFFSTLRYGELQPVRGTPVPAGNVVLVTGIAAPAALRRYIESSFKMVRHLDFRDHHRYTASDLRHIRDVARRHEAMVVTTEKDAVKLGAGEFGSFVDEIPFFFLPVEIEFIKNGKDFDEMVFNAIENVSKSQGNDEARK